MEMKKIRLSGILIFALLLLSLPAAAAPAAAPLKLGYADLQKALNESQAGIKAKDKLQEEAQQLEKDINAKQATLKKMKEDIDKMASVWNKDTLDAKQAELKAKGQEFQKQFMEYGDKLNKKKQAMEEDIIKGLRDTLEEVAKKEGYTYVFERSVGGILYAPDEDDLTPAVIKLYDERYKAGK